MDSKLIDKDITPTMFLFILRRCGYSKAAFAKWRQRSPTWVNKIVFDSHLIKYKYVDSLIAFVGKENYIHALKSYKTYMQRRDDDLARRQRYAKSRKSKL